MHQKARLKNLERFVERDDGLLIATDVAARGLDIPNIDHVIHYQVPQHSDIYDLKFYLCSMRFRYLVFLLYLLISLYFA